MAIEVQYVLYITLQITLFHLVYQTMRISVANDRGINGGSINEQDLDEYLNIISKLTVISIDQMTTYLTICLLE